VKSDTELRDRAPLERTRLANERTLLAYIRTALAVIVAGFGLQLFNTEVAGAAGVGIIVTGLLLIPFGFWRYLRVRRQIELSAVD
jgi:putative membrane protein